MTDFDLEKCRSDFLLKTEQIFIWKNADQISYKKQTRFLFGKMQIRFY